MADVTKEIVLEVGLKDSTAAGTTSAKTRLRELQKTLADMALAGQDGTKAFRDMEREAGKLKDQIGDTQQRIKNLASETRTIDTFVGAIQGITAVSYPHLNAPPTLLASKAVSLVRCNTTYHNDYILITGIDTS